MIEMKFERRKQGRIYTDKEENIEVIERIIEGIDAFEYEYLPKDLIAVYEGSIELINVYKFDTLDMVKLMNECWAKGIHIFVVGEFQQQEHLAYMDCIS